MATRGREGAHGPSSLPPLTPHGHRRKIRGGEGGGLTTTLSGCERPWALATATKPRPSAYSECAMFIRRVFVCVIFLSQKSGRTAFRHFHSVIFVNGGIVGIFRRQEKQPVLCTALSHGYHTSASSQLGEYQRGGGWS